MRHSRCEFWRTVMWAVDPPNSQTLLCTQEGAQDGAEGSTIHKRGFLEGEISPGENKSLGWWMSAALLQPNKGGREQGKQPPSSLRDSSSTHA